MEPMVRKISIAPMMDCTDRHDRFLLRLVSRHVQLFTEMVPAQALLHGDRDRFLEFDPSEHPVALQLGGSDPALLAECASFAAERGYDEINLNVGCPSERVQSGSFGACLMLDPGLVAACVRAMSDAVDIPVTVKSRIGVDEQESWEFLRDFVRTVADGGCRTFIVHARKAVLSGLSPRQNRTVPPLNYERVYRLKQEMPDYGIVINGGVTDLDQAAEHLLHVDGVMIGREAYANPYLLAEVDGRFFNDTHPGTFEGRTAGAVYNLLRGANRPRYQPASPGATRNRPVPRSAQIAVVAPAYQREGQQARRRHQRVTRGRAFPGGPGSMNTLQRPLRSV